MCDFFMILLIFNDIEQNTCKMIWPIIHYFNLIFIYRNDNIFKSIYPVTIDDNQSDVWLQLSSSKYHSFLQYSLKEVRVLKESINPGYCLGPRLVAIFSS